MARTVDFTGHRVRPANVLRAVLTDDKERLSELGRRGAASRKRLAVAKKAQKNREAHAASKVAARQALEDVLWAADRRMLLEEEFHERAVEANEHLCPID